LKDSLIKITQRLLEKNKISFDKKELAFQIQSHPSYPSLHAITGVLDHFNIENIAAEVPTDIKTLQQLPNSFIAQVSTENGNELVTVSKKDKHYVICSTNKRDKKVSENDFLILFTGIIVAVEKNEADTTVKSYKKLKHQILFSILIATAIFLLVFQKTTPYTSASLILNLLGIIISYSILKQEFGESSTIGETFCSGNNEKKDCNAVLSSEGAEIIKNHKLSDLSIIYFSGLLISNLLIKDSCILQIISYLAIPITIYSIYYQYKIVKSWCMLCLSIISLLWIQGIISYLQPIDFSKNIDIYINDTLITIISFIATYLIWDFTKPLVKNNKELQQEKIDAIKFKRNFDLFNSLLFKSTKINTRIENSNEIVFGNKNASLEITIVTNPFCGHCKPVHKTINKILERYHDAVKIIVRFNVVSNNSEDKGHIVCSELIKIYNKNGTEACKKAMDEIYDGMSFEKWITKFKTANDKKENPIKILKYQKDWCTKHAINFTPEILINGYSFPKEYKREDLFFFIEDLEYNFAKVDTTLECL